MSDGEVETVLARTPRVSRWWLIFLLVQGATTVYWLRKFLVEEEGVVRAIVVAIPAALVVALVAALVPCRGEAG